MIINKTIRELLWAESASKLHYLLKQKESDGWKCKKMIGTPEKHRFIFIFERME